MPIDTVYCIWYTMLDMKILYTPSPAKQILAQTFYLENLKGLSYVKLSKKYGFHKNYIMSLSHWYRDHGVK